MTIFARTVLRQVQLQTNSRSDSNKKTLGVDVVEDASSAPGEFEDNTKSTGTDQEILDWHREEKYKKFSSFPYY